VITFAQNTIYIKKRLFDIKVYDVLWKKLFNYVSTIGALQSGKLRGDEVS
jgi:hypothetical protein